MIGWLAFGNANVQRIAMVFVMLCLLIGVGTTGYCLIEGWPVSDGLFMTVITLSTVGYGETQPLSEDGRWFTSCLIFLCVIGMTCWTAALTSFIVEQDLNGQYARRRMLKMISKLKGHVIVCGADQMAQVVIERLSRKRKQIVVIDEDAERLEKLKKRFRRVHYVVGKGTNEMSLAEANILAASTVVAAMDSEVDNLLVTIACKDMGNDLAVFAKSNDISIANSMRKAGVDEVISPCQICGDRIADMVNVQSGVKKKPQPSQVALT